MEKKSSVATTKRQGIDSGRSHPKHSVDKTKRLSEVEGRRQKREKGISIFLKFKKKQFEELIALAQKLQFM